MGCLPPFEGLNRGFVLQGFLRQVFVVQPDVAMQSLFQVLRAVEVMRPEHLFEPSVEALDHAIGLGRSGLGQSVLDAQSAAQRLERVLPAGVFGALAKQSVGELFAIVRQQGLNLERRRLGHRVEERAGCRSGFVALDGDEHPAGGAVNRHKDVAPGRLIGHLRQVLHIHVDVARLIGFEGFGAADDLRRHRQPGVPTTTQQSIQCGAAHLGLNELSDHSQQIIERQQQLCAQIDHQFLLRRVERGLQPMRRVAAVLHGIALAPLANGVAAHTELARQFIVAARGLLNFCADRRGGRGVLVQSNQHVELQSLQSATSAVSTSRPTSSGRLLSSRYSSGT